MGERDSIFTNKDHSVLKKGIYINISQSTLWYNRYDSCAQMCLLLELAMSRVSDVAHGSLISPCLGPAEEYFADMETSLMSVLN